MLRGAKSLIGDAGMKHRMLYCSSHVAHDKTHARVISSGEGHAALADVGVCENAWCCPVCAARLGQQYAAEIKSIMKRLQPTHRVFMLTYTARHDRFMTLADFAGAFKQAQRQLKSGKGWQDLKAAYGIEHSIKSDECTYGGNGWHYHVHELVFIRRDAEKKHFAAANAQAVLGKRWLKMLAKFGLSAEFEISLKATEAHAEISQYINKIGEITPTDTASEIARHDTKKAAGNRTIMHLLHDAWFNDDLMARERWLEFLKWSHRKKRISFSDSLKNLRDENNQGDTEKIEPQTLLLLDPEELRFLWRAGAVGSLIQIASERNTEKLTAWFDRLKRRWKYTIINLSLLD